MFEARPEVNWMLQAWSIWILCVRPLTSLRDSVPGLLIMSSYLQVTR